MKLKDKIRLSLIEFRYDKKEWITSVILHVLVFGCVLFLSTVAIDIDYVMGKFLDKYNPDGYSCTMTGYEEKDMEKLEKMGFSDFFIEDGIIQSGICKSMDKAWKYKIKAILEDKDLYFQDTEEDLMVLLFVKLVFITLSAVLFILMCGNIVNALSIKISKRERYIKMLIGLGMSRKDCGNIYVRFFLFRNVSALAVSLILNAMCIIGVNRYIKRAMEFDTGFSAFKPVSFAMMLFLCVAFMIIIIKRQWRKGYEQ